MFQSRAEGAPFHNALADELEALLRSQPGQRRTAEGWYSELDQSEYFKRYGGVRYTKGQVKRVLLWLGNNRDGIEKQHTNPNYFWVEEPKEECDGKDCLPD